MKGSKILLFTLIALATLSGLSVSAKKKQVVEPSYAWTVKEPLGLHFTSTIDTLHCNFFATVVPTLVSPVYITTGNFAAPGISGIFFERKPQSQFFFADGLSNWLPSTDKHRFYNTRIPMTIVSYNWGGTRDTGQDRIKALFSGNVNRQIELGGEIDYLYSKGSYNYQANKNFIWKLFGSYIGDRYEAQTFFANYNYTGKENGGITDDRYLTDPAEVQGGVLKVDTKTIPTNLDKAHSHLEGHQFYMNHRYKVGYYRTRRDSVADTVRVTRYYVPMTSFIWTMDYKISHHMFLNENASQDTAFFEHTYLNLGGTRENSRMWYLSNTFGIDLLEGSRRWAQFGLSAYATYEIRRYTQPSDSALYQPERSEELTPLPPELIPAQTATDNVLWAGGQLTRRLGKRLNYDVDARFGILGSVAGDISIEGNIHTKFPMRRDSLRVSAFAYFKNEEVPYLMKNYISNHYVWKNDFGKVRRLRVGGNVSVPLTGTSVTAGYETLNNYVYWGLDGTPQQRSGMVHVLNIALQQNFSFRAFHWDNKIIYQTSSDEQVISLPKLAIYSNMYVLFKIARVLHTQIGVDCNYYTKYYAPRYNPATMQFQNQNEMQCGNFALCNVYANFKLRKARFFVMFSHVNQGLFGGKAYFASPHYPLNPRRLQFGVSVDFAH